MADLGAPATKADIMLVLEGLRGVDDRLGALAGRFDRLEARFDALEARFDRLEARFDALEARVGALEAEVQALRTDLENFKVEVNTRFHEFEHRLEGLFSEMETRVIATVYRLAETGILEERIVLIEKRLDMPPAV